MDVYTYTYMHVVALPLHLQKGRSEHWAEYPCQEEFKTRSSLKEQCLSEAKDVPRVKPKALSKQTHTNTHNTVTSQRGDSMTQKSKPENMVLHLTTCILATSYHIDK